MKKFLSILLLSGIAFASNDFSLLSNEDCSIKIKNDKVIQKGMCPSNKHNIFELFNENINITNYVKLDTLRHIGIHSESKLKQYIIDVNTTNENVEILNLFSKYQMIEINNKKYLFLSSFKSPFLTDKGKYLLEMTEFNKERYDYKSRQMNKNYQRIVNYSEGNRIEF